MLVLACCNAAGQFLPPVSMFKDVDNREIFCEELLPVLDCAITVKRIMKQTVHIIFHKTKSRGSSCAIRYLQISVQLPFTAWNYF
jgi:hypothetical protein